LKWPANQLSRKCGRQKPGVCDFNGRLSPEALAKLAKRPRSLYLASDVAGHTVLVIGALKDSARHLGGGAGAKINPVPLGRHLRG